MKWIGSSCLAIVAATCVSTSPAHAAISMTLVGSTATIVGDASPEVLVVDASAGLLQHNRMSDPGFNSAVDFDSTLAGDQTLPAASTSSLSVQLAGGPNSLTMRDVGSAASNWTLGSASIVAPIATISFDGSIGALTAIGGTGNDSFSVLSSAKSATISIESGAGPDAIRMGSAAGELFSIAGDVQISGGASSDTLLLDDSSRQAGRYTPTVIGQAPGRTTVSHSGGGIVSWDASVTTMNFRGGPTADEVRVTTPAATPTTMNIELGRGNDELTLSGNADLDGGTADGGDNVDEFNLNGLNAGVTLDLTGPGNPAGTFGVVRSFEQIVGTPSADVLTGSDAGETFIPGDGNDTVSGRGGDDVFLASGANDGRDEYVGDGGSDHMSYERRNARVTIHLDEAANDGEKDEGDRVDADMEVVTTGVGADILVGNARDNEFRASSGNDMIDGRGGSDVLRGGAGNDRFPSGRAKDGADTVDGGAGRDTLTYQFRRAAVHVTIDVKRNDGEHDERDHVIAIETLLGGRGNDVLVGGRFDDLLFGGPGNDLLRGMSGRDILLGQLGNDVFDSLDRKRDTLDGGAGADRVIRADANDRRIAIP